MLLFFVCVYLEEQTQKCKLVFRCNVFSCAWQGLPFSSQKSSSWLVCHVYMGLSSLSVLVLATKLGRYTVHMDVCMYINVCVCVCARVHACVYTWRTTVIINSCQISPCLFCIRMLMLLTFVFQQIIQKVQQLNSDPLVHGIIVQVSVCRIHKQMVLIQ